LAPLTIDQAAAPGVESVRTPARDREAANRLIEPALSLECENFPRAQLALLACAGEPIATGSPR
jgi:hypothetical protein